MDYKKYYTEFIQGKSADIYEQLLPIAQMQFSSDPIIAKNQKKYFERFMLLNATLYNAPKPILTEYPLFNAEKYMKLYTSYTYTQQCDKKTRKYRRITASTLCL